MEHITEAQPWQVLVLGIACLVFGVVVWIWLHVGTEYEVEEFEPREIVKNTWSALLHWRPVNMSSGGERDATKNAVVPPIVTTFTAAEQPIVTPNNEYSEGLSDKERIAFDTTARNIAAMYQKGVVTNLSKAICAAYGCTVQSSAKPDSTYQMALKAVNKYLPDKNAPQFRMTPEMENAREALGLNK